MAMHLMASRQSSDDVCFHHLAMIFAFHMHILSCKFVVKNSVFLSKGTKGRVYLTVLLTLPEQKTSKLI